MSVFDSRLENFDGMESLPSTAAYAWVRGRGLYGWGGATRIEVGSGSERWERAASKLADVFSEHPDAVAFASFTFDELSDESSVVVPERHIVLDHLERGGLGRTADQRGGLGRTADQRGGLGRTADQRGGLGRTADQRGGLGRTADQMPQTSASRRDAKIRYAGASMSEIEWLEAVDHAVKRIEAGALGKVVLARDVHVWSKGPLDVRVLAARLATRFPECYTFIHRDLVGATPELLIRRTGKRIESQVLAGTVRRGADQTEDDTLGAELLSSAKHADEHRFAVDSVTGVFARICSDWHVAATPTLLKLANVQHLATWVNGTLIRSLTALDVAGLLHPTAAVCGTPTDEAMSLIRELEGMDRGRYGGPVGWVGANGDGEFGIALRCAEIDGTRGRLFAGNGIVAGSLPEDELEETRLKLRAMQSALEDWA